MEKHIKPKSGVEAVDRALQILMSLRPGEGPLTLTAICDRTGLHKSTALRLLKSLEQAQLMHRLEDKRYKIGAGAAMLGKVFTSTVSLPLVAGEPCSELLNSTGLGVSVYERQEESRVCVFRVDPAGAPPDPVQVGDVLPLGQSATGLCFRRYADLSVEGGAVEPIYTLGVYRPGRANLSFPIFGFADRLVGVLTLSGALSDFQRHSIQDLALRIEKAAGRIESSLGR